MNDQNDTTVPQDPSTTSQSDEGQNAESTPEDTNSNSEQLASQIQPAEEAAQDEDYIENVGGSVIDLLEDIENNEDFIQVVAQEMQLDVNAVKSILTPLVDKIHQGQISIEELALIMAAPVVDEVTENPEDLQQPNQ